jgi:indole-3-glycerol phosphate synthase
MTPSTPLTAGASAPLGGDAPDLLRAIVDGTRRIVETRRSREPLMALARRGEHASARGDAFEAAVARSGRVNIIAECKRRSPSKGVLTSSYDPAALAASYERGGAVAISVLTEPMFFDGTLEDLASVRRTVQVPLLRKDFIVDEYQLYEARANGADAILLIVAALEQGDLIALHRRASELGLAALVEVHEEIELRRAVDAGARLVGVNNRNLRTLAVDVDASHRLAQLIPRDVVAVSESGLRTRADLERLRKAGYRAFLIGERFMLDADPARAIGELIGVSA